ncbi:hypothetical protein LINPERHAP2_LOCUS11054 [Linum perenne]
MFGEVPVGVRSGSPEDPSILWGDADRHRASGIFEAQVGTFEMLLILTRCLCLNVAFI